MVIPKYDIGKEVFIYEAGKLVSRIINKIRVTITESEFEVCYLFEKQSDSDPFFGTLYWAHDFYKKENEVFKSLEDFVKRNEAA